MEFQLGESILQGSRAEILEEISSVFMKSRLTYDGAVFFGELILVIKPGENVISRIRDAYEVHKGRIIINGLYYNGNPAELKEIVVQQCVSTNIQFTGTMSFDGFSYKCNHIPLSIASYNLLEKIIDKVPIAGTWDNLPFEGQVEDVRQMLTDYIKKLPMVIKKYDIVVGKSTVSLSDLGKIWGSDLRRSVATNLVNQAIRYMKEN